MRLIKMGENNWKFHQSNLNDFNQSNMDLLKKEFIEIPINIPICDYNFIYNKFEECMGDTEELIQVFVDDTIHHQIEILEKDGEMFVEEVSLPFETMKKINGMLYYYEKRGGKFKPISFDNFIIMMVDELYALNKEIYEEYGDKIRNILLKNKEVTI